MRKKMRLIAMLSAMILSAGTMSVPAFANTGENTGGTTEETVIYAEEFDDADGVIPAEEIGSPDNNIQTEESKTSPSDHSDSGTTEKPAEPANPVEDIYYDMWQYSSKGQVPGINGNVDMNVIR